MRRPGLPSSLAPTLHRSRSLEQVEVPMLKIRVHAAAMQRIHLSCALTLMLGVAGIASADSIEVAGVAPADSVGVAGIAVPASSFFWLQTWGPVNALSAGAMTIGTEVVRAVAVAGAVGPFDGAVIVESVGYALATIDDTDNGPIFLQIAP